MLSSSAERVEEGKEVLIYIDRRRRWIVRVRRGGYTGSDYGPILHDDVVGKGFGTSVRLKLGKKAFILPPLLIDYLERGFKRRTQVIYPKDLGLIIVLLGVGPGSRILEAGIGSGFATSVLANIVRPDGRVYAYEVRSEFAEIAIENLRRVGLDKYVELKLKDVREVEERDLDAALLDMPSPWEALDAVHRALKPGAPIVFFLPTVNQVIRMVSALKSHGGFIDIRCFETLLREYQVIPDAVRPESFMVGHTGYIVFARKVLYERAEQS